MQGITIVGPGRLGSALAVALSVNGYSVERIVYRHQRPAVRLRARLQTAVQLEPFDKVKYLDSAIIFITTQDGNIGAAASELAGKVSPTSCVFHCSGSLSSEVLKPLHASGCAIGSIHPLASISSADDVVKRFGGAYFCIEGDQKAMRVARRLVRALGGQTFQIETRLKPLYHAAAVTASGHVTALFDIAMALLQDAGLDARKSQKVLQPLLAGAAANLATQTPSAALTGPFARVDIETFARQLPLLRSNAASDELSIYLELAERSLLLAKNNGADRSKISRMRKLIDVAKRDIEC